MDNPFFLIPSIPFLFVLSFLKESPATIATSEADNAPAKAEALPPPGVGVVEDNFSKNRSISIRLPLVVGLVKSKCQSSHEVMNQR
jgi:hypothetical protein